MKTTKTINDGKKGATRTREIWHELFFNVSPQKLYEAITDPKKLAQWWTTDV